MNTRVAACLISFLAAFPCRAESKLTRLRESAEPLSSLGGFLGQYVGNCGEKLVSGECRASASAFRKKVNGRRFYLVIGEETASQLLNLGSRPASDTQYAIQITPFFESGGYALTHGSPKSTDRQGNPQLPVLIAKGSAPQGWDVSRVQRLLGTRQVQLQVVFVPQDLWALPRKGGGRIEGVKATIEAIQVTNVRTGDVLATWPTS